MTKQQTAIILGTIQELYPKFAKEPTNATLNIWHEMIGDLDFKLAQIAVKKHASVSNFPPTVAEIRANAAEITSPTMLTEGEAWGEVMRIISKCGYYRPKEAMEHFDPLTKKCVKIITWNVLCLTEDMMATRAHFFKIYGTLSKREVENRSLPVALKQEIELLANKMDF